MQLKEMRPYQLRQYVESGHPMLIPAGCIETHGPHMAIGHDTIIVEEICRLIDARTPCVIAPSFDYGPTGYALGGPEDGTIDPDYDAYGRYVKSILKNFREMGFRRIYVLIMHQGMSGPLALSFKKAAAELSFECVLDKGYPRGWWGRIETMREVAALRGSIEVHPMILPAASPTASGDHAGFNETSFLLAARPELVEQERLDDNSPWYCREDDERNSLRANAAHGRSMIKAVTDAWVHKIDGDRE
jgi:creatinine amidohydrolase